LNSVCRKLKDVPCVKIRLPAIRSFDSCIHAYSGGFEMPGAVQQRAIPYILHARDTLMQSSGRNGKRTALLIGAMGRINFGKCQCQLLVLVPTGHAARQVFSDCCGLGYSVGARVCMCCSGYEDIASNAFAMNGIEFMKEEGHHIMVGSPDSIS